MKTSPQLGLLFAAALASACSAGVSDGAAGQGGDGTGQGGPLVGAGGSGGQASGFLTTGAGGGAGTGGGAEIAEVFGHSASTLYRLDPDTKAVTTVGNFDCSSVIDIALDKDSNLFGTTSGGLYSISKTTAKCTLIQSGSYPNSLSFVPAGTLDPNKEALVGYDGAQYVQIDTVSGAVNDVGGSLGGGLSSSGDVVSVKNGKSYLTANGSGCSTDCLVEINPATGALVKNWGPLGYDSVFGIAFWAGAVYGFTDAGQLFEVTFDNQIMSTTLISEPPNVSFWGAGSTTSAPPDPIPM